MATLQGFPVQTGQSPYYQQAGAAYIQSGKSTIKSTSKRQAAQKSSGDKVRRTIYICDIDQQVS